MGVKPTVDALLHRLTQLEERTAAAEQRAAALEARLVSGPKATKASEPGGGNGKTGPLTRGRFMKAAGMGLAGLAGAAILEKANTKDASATAFLDVVSAQAYIANGIGGTALAPAGYGLNMGGNAHLDRGVSAFGHNYGVVTDSSGTGIGVFAGHGGRANAQFGYYSNINGNPPQLNAIYGDLLFDQTDRLWVQAFRGGWNAVHMGGIGQSLFTAVSTKQYLLQNSDGITWVDMDATGLAISLIPTFYCQAIITANADLWTTAAGHNQDIGVLINGGAYTNKIVGWKESGSIAGAASPNAAYLETIVALGYGLAYTIKLQWKANNNASGAYIVAGAGPYPAGSTTFSPTRLTVRLIPDQAGVSAPAVGVTQQVPHTSTRA